MKLKPRHWVVLALIVVNLYGASMILSMPFNNLHIEPWRVALGYSMIGMIMIWGIHRAMKGEEEPDER